MWSAFRALAALIGLEPSEVSRVEHEKQPTLVQHPLNPEIFIRVRPDPNWTERILEAWNGNLVNSRQERIGSITVPEGKIFFADTVSPDNQVIARVQPGEYDVVLTVAVIGEENTPDFEEHTSHIAIILQDHPTVTMIEPLEGEAGEELGILGRRFMLSGRNVLTQIAGDHAGQWALRSTALMHPTLEDGTKSYLFGAKLSAEGIGEAILFYGGRGRGDYPLYRLADAQNNTVGLMADFYIDNRPWPDDMDD